MVGGNNKPGDLVYVVWTDSEYRSGWIDKDDFGGESSDPCQTAAFFHSATEDYLYLYGSESEEQLMSCLAIPQCAIQQYATVMSAEDREKMGVLYDG